MTQEMRLECLRLAVETMRGHMSAAEVVKAAEAFEKYVSGTSPTTPLKQVA